MKTPFLSLLAGLLFAMPQTVHAVDSCQTVFASSKGKRLTDLAFREKIGRVEEHSVREGQTAAHVYMDSTIDPYLFFAFPAGNSGVALWMKSSGGTPAHLEAVSSPRVVSREGGLNGVEIQARAGASRLSLGDSVLGSMRFIRDRELNVQIPAEVATKNVREENGRLIFERESLNGLARYVLEVEATGDTRLVRNGSSFELVSNREVTFKARGYSSEKALTPLSIQDVFQEKALSRMDRKKLEAFSFLLYKEKLMAGSPRYLSKFGRDSIYTLRVLMDVMKPEAIESLLTATMSGMHPKWGLVSHEQHEGDFVSYVRLKRHEKYKGVDAPMEDYKMIDDDFAFVIVLGEYMKRYPERAKGFFDRTEQRGLSQRDLAARLFRYVEKSTADFARNPTYRHLISLKGHEKTGEWRDSENGLAGGRYPFDVNAALVPAALKALSEIARHPTAGFQDAGAAESFHRAFEVWNTRAAPLFEVRVSAAQAKKAGEDYLRELGIPARELGASPREDLVFPAIALDAKGEPIPVIHSDDSLMMTFGYPSPAYLRTVSQRYQLQFPYGLSTPVGVLVANPVFASRELKGKFDETKYHGRVSWTMQEDLIVYGISRQLLRDDLSSSLKADLRQSSRLVEKAIASKAAMGGTEVFSIFYRDGRYEAVPFAGDAKSNSNQLWSHLRLAFPGQGE
ncbi:MAG: hypothetical protein KF802_10610 [Bdellovibrionaceae bacterium]|nr:hypothetical protein [Pseudobdellovibrionaceae bacterium]MBX3034637.1 hypothetical protein [Pseudobdellovibrionaceae bacterium]